MGADVCELVVYTQNGAVTFQVKATADNFEDRVAEALEEGTVTEIAQAPDMSEKTTQTQAADGTGKAVSK